MVTYLRQKQQTDRRRSRRLERENEGGHSAEEIKSGGIRAALGCRETATLASLRGQVEYHERVAGLGRGGANVGAVKWRGRVAENDGFKLLVMSHVEAGGFHSLFRSFQEQKRRNVKVRRVIFSSVPQ